MTGRWEIYFNRDREDESTVWMVRLASDHRIFYHVSHVDFCQVPARTARSTRNNGDPLWVISVEGDLFVAGATGHKVATITPFAGGNA